MKTMFHVMLAILGLIMALGCGGAFHEIRRDRQLAEMTDKDGNHRIVLVSKSALDDVNGTFEPLDERHWTESELQSGFNQLVIGGKCRITNSVIPPMTPVEAKDIWVSMVFTNGRYLLDHNLANSPDDALYLARQTISSFLPDLVELARLYDSDLKLEAPDHEIRKE